MIALSTPALKALTANNTAPDPTRRLNSRTIRDDSQFVGNDKLLDWRQRRNLFGFILIKVKCISVLSKKYLK